MADTPLNDDDWDAPECPADDETNGEADVAEARKPTRGLILAIAFFVVAVALAGFVFFGGEDGASDTATGTDGSEEATEPVGAGMAGPVVDVVVSEEAIASEPAAPDLSTPESAVLAYIDWTSYAYRIGQSQVALLTLSSYQEVHVDSYVQYNIQQKRLLDETLTGIEFGAITIEGDKATVPARESWTYSYISIEEAGKVIGGPYDIEYDTVYSLVKNETGGWVVDSVEATALGEVQ